MNPALESFDGGQGSGREPSVRPTGSRASSPRTPSDNSSIRRQDDGHPASTSRVLVVDSKPLSLLATAGVLHHAGMQCVCAGSIAALRKACGLDHAQDESGPGIPLIDLLVWDVGEIVPAVMSELAALRDTPVYRDLPAILIADSKWAGLQLKTEAMEATTHCLFQPIDPKSLTVIAEQLLWMPAMQSIHRHKGSRPSRPGWVGLT